PDNKAEARVGDVVAPATRWYRRGRTADRPDDCRSDKQSGTGRNRSGIVARPARECGNGPGRRWRVDAKAITGRQTSAHTPASVGARLRPVRSQARASRV